MSVSSDIREFATTVAQTLPPAFVALLLINLLFILGLLWFMHDLAVTRIEAVTKIFQACTVALTNR